jgi:hypothetical protein
VREEGGRPEKNSLPEVSSFQEALNGAGISENTAFVWQKVARVPGRSHLLRPANPSASNHRG